MIIYAFTDHRSNAPILKEAGCGLPSAMVRFSCSPITFTKEDSMRKQLAVPVGLLALVLFLAVSAVAGPLTLNWGSHLGASSCDHAGAPVINIVERVKNNVDSGIGGNYWAFDNYTRQIQVWLENDGSYCVRVSYQGKFDAVSGQLPRGYEHPRWR